MFHRVIKQSVPRVLSEQDVKKSLPYVTQDGVIAQLVESLTGGPVMIAISLALGVSNALLGYLLALPFLCHLAQFPGMYVVEKFRHRKWVMLFVSSPARFALIGVAFLLLFPKTPGASYWLAFFYTLRYFGAGFATSSWNSWMRDLVPQSILGKFFGNRYMYMVVAALGVSLLVASGLEWLPIPANYFYVGLIVAAICLVVYGFWVIGKIDEPKMAAAPENETFMQRFRMVFSDGNFVRLIVFLGCLNFSINLAVPFFTVYILEQLKLNLGLVLILTSFTQITSILVMRIWGAISDKFSNKSVLAVTVPLYVLSIFLFLFTDYPDPHPLTVPLLFLIYILVGLAQSGVTLASSNIALKLAPQGRASVYLSVNGIVTAVMAGTAPVLGGFFADFFVGKELFLTFNWHTTLSDASFYIFGMEHWDFFFFFSSVLGFLCRTLLRRVREEGEVCEKIVISSFLSSFYRTISPAALSQRVYWYFWEKKQPVSVVPNIAVPVNVPAARKR